MFTVIICSAEFARNTKNHYSHIIEAVEKNKDLTLCIWNTEGETFEEALPDLPNIISGKAQWRAVVVQDSLTFGIERIDKRNPFDFVGAIESFKGFEENSIFTQLDELLSIEKFGDVVEPEKWADLDAKIKSTEDLIKKYRLNKFEKYDTAVSNPLTKLGVWLIGISEKMPDILSSIPVELYADDVEINREYYKSLLKESVLASEIEQYRILKHKYKCLTSNFELGSMTVSKPETILVLSERVATHAEDAFYSKPGKFEEIEYSNFCDDNLYAEKMRFVFFDINYENKRKNTKDYLAFLSSILTFAVHEIPEYTVRPERVYKGETTINDNKVLSFYNYYLSKLYKTKELLQNTLLKHKSSCQKQDVSAEESIENFESDVKIPVVITKEYNTSDLKAQYKKIGLSKDCPGDEYHYWYNQACEITKKFIRYLREPRRALKKSVKDDFRLNNAIINERAINLNEFQLEDLEYRLIEEEQKMVETTTVSLFKTKEYTDKIEKADENIRKGISQRMTKKKTLITGLIAAFAYLFGFIPLLFSVNNEVSSFSFSLVLVSVSMALFLAVGFIFLIVMRKKLINRFKHFNYVMSGILNDIENGLAAFSRYLSHACNVMREFSVFNRVNKKEDFKLNVIKKHLNGIERKIAETEEMFAGDYNLRTSHFEEVEPYDYDFTLAQNYPYDIPYKESEDVIEFVVKDNFVDAPVEYVESITLTREELYD